MGDKKYQVFISSTYKDLKKERAAARDAILGLYHFPVGMEMFGACNEDQWEIIKRDIDNSDYYILIIGKCYGSEVPGEGISYTQKEFRYALSKNIPILAFIKDDDAKTSPTFQEIDLKRIGKLNCFIEEVKKGRTITFWKDESDLKYKVANSLEKQIERTPRVGWVRLNKVADKKEKSEVIISSDEEKIVDALSKGKTRTVKSIARDVMLGEKQVKYLLDSLGDMRIAEIKSNSPTEWGLVEKPNNSLSEDEMLVFRYLKEDDNADIVVDETLSGFNVIVGRHPLAKNFSSREEARLRDLLDSLQSKGYIRTSNDKIYRLTKQGFDMLDSI